MTCHVHRAILPDESPSTFARMFRRSSSYQSQIDAAHRFVVESYQPGDDVMLLSWFSDEIIGGPGYNAIRQLATALDAGILAGPSKGSVPTSRVPIKCLYLDHSYSQQLRWSVVDRVLSDFPPTLGNLLCDGDLRAYVVQRGSWGRVIRKEAWMTSYSPSLPWLDWLVVQTSHILKYDQSDLVDFNNPSGLVPRMERPKLLSATTHLNYTKRRRGVPCDDAIPTGGQLTRLSKVEGRDYGSSYQSLVSSYQSFAQGEYDDICNTPLVGPRSL
ncbi:hypothetical protein BDV93DRAFT_610295 [Ceratobasidium sp. AG-I]|nr:hypothetical protein BDV93DRAFT_610295 [Ceratobasidium sp. AG-I]